MIAVIIGMLIFLPLLLLAFAHLLWALGTSWPLRSPELLAQTIVGTAGITRMPSRWLTLGVTILLFVAGIVAMGLTDHDDGGVIRTALGCLLAAGFLTRGVLGYTTGWRARHPVEPFATSDRKTYSPLCLWIGAGFLILVIMRLA